MFFVIKKYTLDIRVKFTFCIINGFIDMNRKSAKVIKKNTYRCLEEGAQKTRSPRASFLCIQPRTWPFDFFSDLYKSRDITDCIYCKYVEYTLLKSVLARVTLNPVDQQSLVHCESSSVASHRYLLAIRVIRAENPRSRGKKYCVNVSILRG